MKSLVKERPILFKGEMVRAILEGRKTQTRRVIKSYREEKVPPSGIFGEGIKYTAVCPYGQPGDRLWCKETLFDGNGYAVYKADDKRVTVKASDGLPALACWRWQRDVLPSIHMPRKCSRIILEITNVRVERLQDISEEDAKAEGVERGIYDGECFRTPDDDGDDRIATYIHGYRFMWDRINGKDSWQQNPWVWVIEFKRVNAEAR